MSACYSFICVPGAHSAMVFSELADFLRSQGLGVINQRVQTTQNAPMRFDTNKVLFVSRLPDSWIQIVAWASELNIDFAVWYFSNPLAVRLSRTMSPALFLWSFNGGSAAGYSVFQDGALCESQSVGHLGGISDGSFLNSNSSHLAAILNDPAFHYREFIRSANADFEVATATLAERLGCKWHLLDIMDLIDGEGGIAVNAHKYVPMSTEGWTALEYATTKGTNGGR